MFKRLLQTSVLLLVLIFTTFGSEATVISNAIVERPDVVETVIVKMEGYTYIPTETIKVETLVKQKPPDKAKLSNNDIELIALVTMAEAEGESEKGKRLVIDAILNRVDSKHFPNSVHDVVYQKNQFTSMWNERVQKCHVKDDICQLVREELECRTNSDVIFFQTTKYSIYGTPLFKEGNHYFSSY